MEVPRGFNEEKERAEQNGTGWTYTPKLKRMIITPVIIIVGLVIGAFILAYIIYG